MHYTSYRPSHAEGEQRVVCCPHLDDAQLAQHGARQPIVLFSTSLHQHRESAIVDEANLSVEARMNFILDCSPARLVIGRGYKCPSPARCWTRFVGGVKRIEEQEIFYGVVGTKLRR